MVRAEGKDDCNAFRTVAGGAGAQGPIRYPRGKGFDVIEEESARASTRPLRIPLSCALSDTSRD
jgi:hypothetical protein